MDNQGFDPKVLENLKLLQEKFKADGQDLSVHLEGLYHTSYLKYWDYIHLDSLLSLQKPKTDFPDEMIFITYHQITELYFKMVLHELALLKNQESVDRTFFLKKVERVNWYFSQLIESFDIISVGLDQEEFLKFRSALYPASGFQSVQYRKVEIASTDFINLVSKDSRDKFQEDYTPIEEMFEEIYWKKGAIDSKTGQKTLTLRLFEKKYNGTLIRMAYEYKNKNMWSIFKRLPFGIQEDIEIINAMKRFDTLVNINWPLAHYKYAVRYLFKAPQEIQATGGTNWQKYLPPRFQKQIFFPDLYTSEEIENWGKSWVESQVLNKNTSTAVK
jgi:tryptophan 2,3-dioxygenase